MRNRAGRGPARTPRRRCRRRRAPTPSADQRVHVRAAVREREPELAGRTASRPTARPAWRAANSSHERTRARAERLASRPSAPWRAPRAAALEHRARPRTGASCRAARVSSSSPRRIGSSAMPHFGQSPAWDRALPGASGRCIDRSDRRRGNHGHKSHAALRARTRSILDDLGMHRAGVFGAARRGLGRCCPADPLQRDSSVMAMRSVGFLAQVLLRVGPERVQAVLGAEVVLRSLVLERSGGFRRIDGHAADRIERHGSSSGGQPAYGETLMVPSMPASKWPGTRHA